VERVGDILKTVLDPDFAAKAQVWHGLFASWEAIAGPDLAGLTWLVEVDKVEAIVAVEHPAAAQLVAFHRERILARITRDHPRTGIERLRVMVRPHGVAAVPPAAQQFPASDFSHKARRG
jgi:hypothetical protein